MGGQDLEARRPLAKMDGMMERGCEVQNGRCDADITLD